MSLVRVFRYETSEDVATYAAQRLADSLVGLQTDGRIAQLCLTGGRIATRMYNRFAEFAPPAGVDPNQVELWWGDERFVATDDAERNAGPALAALARTLSVSRVRTHPMPSAGGHADIDASAAHYGNEVGDTVFDICLLGMGSDGHVASVFPDHPSFEAATAPGAPVAIGVTGAPKPPPERISLTLPTLSRSREVWFLVSGDDKAEVFRRVMEGDMTLPAAHVRAAERVLWFVDDAAAQHLPRHRCRL